MSPPPPPPVEPVLFDICAGLPGGAIALPAVPYKTISAVEDAGGLASLAARSVPP